MSPPIGLVQVTTPPGLPRNDDSQLANHVPLWSGVEHIKVRLPSARAGRSALSDRDGGDASGLEEGA